MKFHSPLLAPVKIKREKDALWMNTVATLNKAARIQSSYKVYKNEVKDPNEANHKRRETAVARRARLDGIIAQS